MQPNTQPIPPTALAPADIARIKKANKLKLTWGIICLVGPTALLIISIIAYFALHFLTGGSWQYAHGDSELFANPPLLRTIGNILLFLVGSVATLTWLPGVIIGIILLATRKRS